MSLNAQSPIPLYRQLADRIRADIDNGSYAVAARIPSEHELAACYTIGRPTVRQATDLLVRQGLLERRRGSGTYVLPPSRAIDLFSLAGTSAALQKSELNIQLELVKGPIRERLNSDKNAAHCLRVERRACVDDVAVLYETLWFDADLFQGLENRSLQNQSLSKLVREVFFLEPTSADQTFYVITADQQQSKRLDVAVGTPLLRVLRKLHFGEHRGVLDAEIVCRTDCFEFSQTLYPARVGEENLVNSTAPAMESLSV